LAATWPKKFQTLLAGGPVKLKPSSCSASAITTAAIQAGD
jgi:hypothetical protein